MLTQPPPGYVGGTVLSRILSHPDRSSFDITVLVRNKDKAKTLSEKFGLKTVIGTHQELEKIASLAERAQYVLNLVGVPWPCLCYAWVD